MSTFLKVHEFTCAAVALRVRSRRLNIETVSPFICVGSLQLHLSTFIPTPSVEIVGFVSQTSRQRLTVRGNYYSHLQYHAIYHTYTSRRRTNTLLRTTYLLFASRQQRNWQPLSATSPARQPEGLYGPPEPLKRTGCAIWNN